MLISIASNIKMQSEFSAKRCCNRSKIGMTILGANELKNSHCSSCTLSQCLNSGSLSHETHLYPQDRSFPFKPTTKTLYGIHSIVLCKAESVGLVESTYLQVWEVWVRPRIKILGGSSPLLPARSYKEKFLSKIMLRLFQAFWLVENLWVANQIA